MYTGNMFYGCTDKRLSNCSDVFFVNIHVQNVFLDFERSKSCFVARIIYWNCHRYINRLIRPRKIFCLRTWKKKLVYVKTVKVDRLDWSRVGAGGIVCSSENMVNVFNSRTAATKSRRFVRFKGIRNRREQMHKIMN